MSQLTYLNVIDFVLDYLPGIPNAKIGRKLNLVIQDIYDEIAQIERSTFTTRAPTTTGTITVVAGSASVSFSGTPLATTDTLRMIQIYGVSEWFNLTYVSTSSGTLSSVWPSTSGSGLAYKIVYPTQTFPVDVAQVLNARREGYDPLEFSTEHNAQHRAYSLTPGVPRWYSTYLFDSSGSPDDLHRIYLTPPPDAAYTYMYSYIPKPALITVDGATSQVLGLAAVFNLAVQFGTLALCFGQDDDESSMGPWWGRYQKELQKALAHTSAESPKRRQSAYRTGRGITTYDSWPI